MKIIGGRDYYDGCGMSHDAATGVFTRHTKEIDVDWIGRASGVIGGNYSYNFRTKLIGFCGKLYPVIEHTWNDNKKEESGTDFYYSFEEFDPVRDKVKKLKYTHLAWHSGKDFVGWDNEDYAKMWFDCDFESFRLDSWNSKDRKNYVKPKDLFLEHKVPYFILESKDIGIRRRTTNEHCLTLNPCLKDYKFYRIFDAYSAYQEIEMFINNQIVRPDDPYIAPVDDKIKAESHGFNKESFRKPKGKKQKKKIKNNNKGERND